MINLHKKTTNNLKVTKDRDDNKKRWYVAFGRAVYGDGQDFHGAGGVRFDTKVEGGPLGEGGERYYNYIRLVRNTN